MEGVHVDVLDEEVDDGAMAATAAEMCASAGDRNTKDPDKLRARIGKAQTQPVGARETLTGRTTDEKNEGGSREAVQVALEDVVVEEPLDGAVGDVEEFM